MLTRYRRSLPARPLTTLLAAVLILAACGPNIDTASGGPSVAPSNVASAASTAQPSGDPGAPSADAGDGTQTDTGWGRIWDAVPPGFPTFPGSTVADPVSPDPVSATYAVEGGDAGEIMAWMQTALETAGFGTESLSGPLESGSFVLESVGEGECQVETTVAPMGGLTVITVRYGAGCPAA